MEQLLSIRFYFNGSFGFHIAIHLLKKPMTLTNPHSTICISIPNEEEELGEKYGAHSFHYISR